MAVTSPGRGSAGSGKSLPSSVQRRFHLRGGIKQVHDRALNAGVREVTVADILVGMRRCVCVAPLMAGSR